MAVDFERLRKDEDEEGGYIPPVLYVPNIIDVEFTGDCEFNCRGCWGTKPNEYGQELSLNQWMEIFGNFDELPDDHVYRVVITGGEALLRKDLGKFVCRLQDAGKQITLSTTGLDYHHQLPDILGKLSSIGLPIDGPSANINGLWRNNSEFPDGALEVTLDALKLIQKLHPELQTSIRTLVHGGNIDYITEIPKFLEKSGIDISRLRWILYELNTRIRKNGNSILVSSGVIKDSKLGTDNFTGIVKESGSRFREVAIRNIGNIAGRNFIINPSGECRAVVETDTHDKVEEIEFGNIHEDFEGVIELLNTDIGTLGAFSISARSGPEYFYHIQEEGIDID